MQQLLMAEKHPLQELLAVPLVLVGPAHAHLIAALALPVQLQEEEEQERQVQEQEEVQTPLAERPQNY